MCVGMCVDTGIDKYTLTSTGGGRLTVSLKLPCTGKMIRVSTHMPANMSGHMSRPMHKTFHRCGDRYSLWRMSDDNG